MSDELKKLLKDAKELFDSGKKDEYLEKLESIYESYKDPVVVYFLFAQYVRRLDYDKALKYLLILGKTKQYMNDWYVYALLLSNFIILPDDVEEKLSTLDTREFLTNFKDTRFNDLKCHNLVREAIAEGKYHRALKYIKSIQYGHNMQSQEYIMFKLLNEKIIRQPKRFIKAFKEERYGDILAELDKITFITTEERVTIQLINDLYDALDGVVFNRTRGDVKNIIDAVYYHDYQKALTFVNENTNELIVLILRKIIELTNENVVEQYKGNLGTLFYDYCYRINAAIEQNDFMLIKNTIIEYFGILNRWGYNHFFINLVDYFEAMGSGIENITNILADIVYRKPLVDTEYLKKLFGDAIRAKNDKACESLLKAIKSLRESDKKNIDIEYLEHVYNYQRYLREGIEYAGMDMDIVIYDNIKNIHDRIMIDRLPEKVIAKNDYEERVIRNAINSHYDLAYMKIANDDGTITFYVKKQNHNKTFERDNLLYHAKFFLNTGNFEGLKGLLLHGLTLVNRFDYTMLSLLAYAYEKLGEEESLARIVEVLKDGWSVSDYHEIIEDDELALIDVNSEYMYGIPNIENIINEVIENEISLDKVALAYNVASEDIPYVILIIAREYYKLGNIELGDFYYYSAEKAHVEDKEYSYFLECVKANKPYYNSNSMSFIKHVKKLINKQNKTNE